MKVKKKSQKQRAAQRLVLMATQCQEEPAKILIAQADHHQGHVHYGDAAGKQCTCNVLSQAFLLAAQREEVKTWDSHRLNVILNGGMEIYSKLHTGTSSLQPYLMVTELPKYVEWLDSI